MLSSRKFLPSIFGVALFALIFVSPFYSQTTPDPENIRREYDIPELDYVVLSSGSVLEMKNLGVKRFGMNFASEAVDRFPLGSNTKAITGFIVALLVTQKKLSWETKFFALFPELKKNSNPVYYKLTFDEMIKPQIQIFSKTQFPVPPREMTDENKSIHLAYGLGWGLMQTPHGKAFFKEGHDDGWQNYSICFPDKKIAVVIMSNSGNAESLFKELLELTIKDVYTPWKWQIYTPYNLNQ